MGERGRPYCARGNRAPVAQKVSFKAVSVPMLSINEGGVEPPSFCPGRLGKSACFVSSFYLVYWQGLPCMI